MNPAEARRWDRRWIGLNVVATAASIGVLLVVVLVIVSAKLGWPEAVVYWAAGIVAAVAVVGAAMMQE